MATQYTAGLSAGQVLTASTMNSIGAAWESWTPTINSQTGTLTTTTLNAAKYCRINKFFIAEIDVTFNNIGTGAGYVQLTMPTGFTIATLSAGSMVGFFREYQNVGFYGAFWIENTSKLNLQQFSGASPLGTGNRIGGLFACELA
jgi:hypothetical protein